MSICAAGSSYQVPLLGIFLCLLIDAFIIGLFIALRAQSLLGLLTRYLHLKQVGQKDADADLLRLQQSQAFRFQDFLNEDKISDVSLNLSFTNIFLRSKHPKRTILSRLQGTIHSGSVLGIIGASGSASFVNIVSGRTRPTRGFISINDQKGQPAQLRDLIGFIAQHDVVLPDFTVRENIMYSGRVLLGGQLSDHEIQEYVNFVISSLGLETICDQLVGGLQEAGGRGISGGEYKRVSIALALAAAPKALILDEPTSGLDATAAHSLMKLLHSLSRHGIMVYLGEAAKAQSYFEKLGHNFPIASNPADVILDVLTNHPQAQDTEATFPTSSEEIDSLPAFVSADNLTELFETIKQRRASWLRQLWLAFIRSIIQQTRQTTGLALEIGSSAVVGLMIGLAAFESRGHFFQGIYHQPFDLLSSAVDYRLVAEQGLLCCLAIACAAGPPGVKIFGEEKLTFWRESQSGHSRSAYFLGKNLAVCIRMLVSSLHFTAFYLILAAPMIPFHTQLGLSFLYFYCIYGLGCVVSAITRREDGPLLCMLLGLIISALSGCAPRLSTVRTWHLEWFWYCWPATWFSEAFYQENTAPVAYLYDIHDAATFTGYSLDRTGMDMGFLFLIGTLYRALSYFLFVFWGWRPRR